MVVKRTFIYLLSVLILFLAIRWIIHANYRDFLYPRVNLDLSEVNIDSSSLEIVQANLSTIFQYADQYNISPKAIAGVIIAERSLHKGPANQFEEYYVKRVFLEKSDSYLERLAIATRNKVENKKLQGETQEEFGFRLNHGLIWTIGLCQISIMKSLQIDSLMSIEEKRSQKTVKENIYCLLIPKCNIKYCAFELNTIRNTFKSGTGVDISNQIGVLCTLYNTGKVKESIDKFKRTALPPKPNSFGEFIELNSNFLDKILKGKT